MKMLKLWLGKLTVHKVNYIMIGLALGLILGFFAFHRESTVDRRLKDIAVASYPDDAQKQRQALATFKSSLDDLYFFSQNGGVEQARKDALDAKAKNDANSISVKLEQMYADNGFYPGTITQTSLDGIAYESLIDRGGGFIASEQDFTDNEPANTFGGSAPAPRYRYAAYDCQQQLEVVACQKYVLFVWLESGSTLTKKSQSNSVKL